ncbi:hypothetical protein [Cupriavidus sp. TMH.W2]|uniref:hypothetical protein n=1 Tax=Cupriavidus sp. TMH.W2 TaxID=3434465 RepID=UPI003D776940
MTVYTPAANGAAHDADAPTPFCSQRAIARVLATSLGPVFPATLTLPPSARTAAPQPY